MNLPQWIKDDFKSKYDVVLAFYSRIYVAENSSSPDKFLYSELIEIIPLELKEEFKEKANSNKKINGTMSALLKEIDLEII